jgi:hypothetical protein
MNTYLCIDINKNDTIVSFTILDREKSIEYCGDQIIGKNTLPHDGSLQLTVRMFATESIIIPLSDQNLIDNILNMHFNSVKNKDYKEILHQLNLLEYII